MKNVACIAGLGALLATSLMAQSNAPQGSPFAAVPTVVPVHELPEFDVADLQPTKEVGSPSARFLPGGRVEFRFLPVKFMILAAWGFENDENRVTGGPGWVSTDTYHVVAKARPDSSIANLRLMLRNLLIKRFGLEMHIGEEPAAVYVLEKGKGSPKITQSATQEGPQCQRNNVDGAAVADCHHITMDELANAFRNFAPAYIDKPVVNLTGLSGQFDVKLTWTPRDQLLGTGANTPGKEGVLDASIPTAGGNTIFEAVDRQMGLRLTSARHPIPIVVIDKINRTPTEN